METVRRNVYQLKTVLKENIRGVEMQFCYHTYGTHFTEAEQFLKEKKSLIRTGSFTVLCCLMRFRSAAGDLYKECWLLKTTPNFITVGIFIGTRSIDDLLLCCFAELMVKSRFLFKAEFCLWGLI